MQEGGLERPQRRPLAWREAAFFDEAALDAELRRVFDICHGCRRCFNLCDSFPRLFDLIDASPTGEMDGVDSAGFAGVVAACTLCDMCYMTKCPYVPPHPFDIDFPHLMIRARAAAAKRGEVPFAVRQLTAIDRNGRLAVLAAPLVNWLSSPRRHLLRRGLEAVAKVHRAAALPRFGASTFVRRARKHPPAVAADAPARGRKAVLYATCFVNYNNPGIGEAAQAVLARNGVQTRVVHPGCCGMPQLEQGDIADVARRARHTAAVLKPWIDDGHTVVALTPSCALMLRSEWPLLLPDDADVAALAAATRDISEYIVDIANKEGLAPGLQPLDGGAWVHLACHARAQNIGPKAVEMLRLVPGFTVGAIERCSGHGGSWGVMAENFEVGLRVGKPVARQVVEQPRAFVASECPLAAEHIVQGAQMLDAAHAPSRAWHPVEILARAYGFTNGEATR